MRRLVREQGGFTLPEMMVTIMVMLVVLFALYNIFDMSLRTFSFGNDKVEAVENARLGMEKMEREIRAAYPRDKTAATPDARLLDTWTPTEIKFGNDLDPSSGGPANRKIECPNPAECETITYRVYKPAGSSTYALGRAQTPSGTLQPVVEYLDYVGASDTGLRFRYFESDATTEVSPGSGQESDVAIVRMEIRVKIDGRQDATQVLTTDVALRNRGA